MARRESSTIVCAYGYTVCISNEWNVYSFGSTDSKGHGHEENKVIPPKQIPNLKCIQAIDCGWGHTICLDIEGNVFTFGRNYFGQLGVGKDVRTLGSTHIPQKVNLPPIKQISSGSYFSLCLSERGHVFSFGHQVYGQLGHSSDYYYCPVKIDSLSDIEFIICGSNTCFCKSSKNEIFAWGRNDQGQLGIGIIEHQYRPILCTNWPNDIIDIKSGAVHTLVLTNNQEVYSCGGNYSGSIFSGQLGRSVKSEFSPYLSKIEELSEITRIECGYYHSICCDIYNNIFVFGDNQYGQLGLGDTELTYKSKPIKHPTLSDVVGISSRGWQTIVKTLSNEIFAFGWNEFCQLGLENDITKYYTATQTLKNNENIWSSNIKKSKAKSARK